MSRQRWAVAFGATAAAVALIVVVAVPFATRARPPATPPRTAHAAATQTASAQALAVAAALGPVVAISMDSPTDGWAISQLNNNPGNQSAIALYHFDGSAWSLSKLPQNVSLSGVNSPTIQMLSATDGWVVDGRYLLHYDGAAWNLVNITLAGNAQVTQVMALDMLTPTLGWAAIGLDDAGANAPKVGFVRYDGQQWTLEPSNFTLTGLDPNSVAITGLSATMSNDVWAVGTDFVSVPQGTSTSEQVGFVLHRVNGVWLLATTLNQPHAATSLRPQGILMTGPTNGWIIGSSVTLKQTSDGTDETSHALLLHYDFHQTGTRWVPVDAPIANPSGGDELRQIVANEQNNIWVSGGSAGAQITPGKLAVTSLLLHYDGAKWTQVIPSFEAIAGVSSVGIFNIALAPDGTLWAVGALERVQSSQGLLTPFISFYSNGVWSVAPPISGK